MNHYTAGNGAQQIKLAVDISTNGFAWTQCFTIAPDNTKLPIPDAVSDASGDINTMAVGSAKSLQGSFVHIVTKVELFWDDIDTRKIEFGKIGTRYTLDGGTDGRKEFTTPDQTLNANGDFTTIYILMTVKLD